MLWRDDVAGERFFSASALGSIFFALLCFERLEASSEVGQGAMDCE